MEKKVIVLSLGGSIIIPDNVDTKFLKEFKKTILKNTKHYNFVIVCGGGSVARKYISSLREIGTSEKLQSLAGISATRMNARFMTYFFDKDAKHGVPEKEKTVEMYLKEYGVVFCGALEYKPDQTSDSTAAGLARHFKAPFINITNVNGLYNKDPRTHKDAKFIPSISWKEFENMASKLKYKPGQHFVLDQTAAEMILHHKIPTYITGKDMKQLDNILNNKKFNGTLIKD